MRILVTGGAGFIGSHLCERFLTEGHQVTAVDNLLTGSKKNIELLSRHKNFLFLKKDVSKEILFKGSLDKVFHFASPASPPDYLKFPLETMRVGSMGTFNALELAKSKKAIFVMASTSEVYGDPAVHPQKENYWGYVNSVGPRAVYDEAKRFSEAMTMSYLREGHARTKIVRIFNTYGPRMRPEDGRVIPNFISQALLGKALTIYGKGSQTRSYCYVSDLIEGIVRLSDSQICGPVNLGNPYEKSVSQLAQIILKLTGSKSRVVFKSLPPDDPRQRCPDIGLAKSKLGWEPKVLLKDGLLETIDYFKKILL